MFFFFFEPLRNLDLTDKNLDLEFLESMRRVGLSIVMGVPLKMDGLYGKIPI